MKQKVKETLDTFEPITLAEMERVALMDRVDMKFSFHISLLPQILSEVRDDYRSLEVVGTRMSRYETLYYDTPEFDLYTDHHNEQANRYKIRVRKYVESKIDFFEIKFKNNKGRTIKTRVLSTDPQQKISGTSEQLLGDIAKMSAGNLEPKLWVNYNRITLVNKHDEERLTIDIDIQFTNEKGNAFFPGLVIVEAKQTRIHETKFIKVLRKHHIREGGSSKYCFAVSTLESDLKKNNFKPYVRYFQKINDDTNAA